MKCGSMSDGGTPSEEEPFEPFEAEGSGSAGDDQSMIGSVGSGSGADRDDESMVGSAGSGTPAETGSLFGSVPGRDSRPASPAASSPVDGSPEEAVPPGGSGASYRHRVGGGVTRPPILVALLVVLVVCALIDRAGSHSSGSGPASLPAALQVPVAAPAKALSSSWFCAGATDTQGGEAPGSVVIANSGNSPTNAVVNLIASNGKRAQVPVTVPAGSRVAVPEDIPSGAPWIGASVDVDAGATSVEQFVNGPGGVTATPCATSGSSHWYFATGQSLVNAGVEITLINPYPSDSVVDLSFTTEQGTETPVDYQGLVVPPGGMLAINLGDHLRRRQQIATTVTARTGRVVAWKTQWVTTPPSGSPIIGSQAAANPLSDPAAPIPGVTVALGAPSAGTNWVWADGQAGNGIAEQYVIYNPGPVTADVRLSVQLDQGVAEPFELSVPPYQVIPIQSDQQARIPAGVTHSAVLESTNGVPVVAEKVVAATAPSPWSGLGDMLGMRVPAQRWLLGAAFADSSRDGWVVLYNPTTQAVQVNINMLTAGTQVPLAGQSPVSVPPDRRIAVHVNQGRPSLQVSLIVSSPLPIYAEYDIYGIGTPGIGLGSGVPLS